MQCPKCKSDNPDTLKFCGDCGAQLSQDIPEVTKTLETPVQELTRGTLFADRFEIIEELGTGGMGKVYRVEDRKSKEEIALKLIRPEIAADEKTIDRFRNELTTARKIRHKNICGMYDLGEDKGSYYITMEYVPGEDLKSLIRRVRIDTGAAIKIAKQICEGLSEAHRLGVIHRDLKPSNIMIDKAGDARIMDFGIARSIKDKALTGDNVIIGTPDYMSPEQVEGEELDRRSDIYSLGVALYEMLTGERPFKGDTPLSVAIKHKSETPPNPKRLNDRIPDRLSRLVLICLEKDKEKRYQSAEELLSALTKIEEKKLHIIDKEQKKKSIAVLPFADMSPEKDQEYFCDGIAEEIINALTQIKKLKVIARTSAFMFKEKHEDVREIGAKLGVAHLLEGSVRKTGNRLRITAQLINVEDGSHLWSERYDREMEDIFNVQDEISLQISKALKLKLLETEEASIVKHTTENVGAYNYYMEGRYCLNKNTDEWIRKAIIHFDKAIQEDENYAAAYAGLAETYIHLYGGIGVMAAKDDIPIARKAAQKALAIDPELAEAHVAMGMIALYYDWDRTKIKKCFTKAIELSPNYVKSYIWYAAYFIYFEKDYARALDLIKIAVELDPLDLLLKVVKLNIYTWEKKFDEALGYCQTLIDLEPAYAMGHYFLGMIYGYMGLFDKAISRLMEAIKLGGRSIHHIGLLGYIYARAGQKAEARKLLDEIMQRVEQGSASSSWVARVYAGLGETDKVFEWLDKAYTERDMSLIYINCELEFAEVRSDPRFNILLKKIGLIT